VQEVLFKTEEPIVLLPRLAILRHGRCVRFCLLTVVGLSFRSRTCFGGETED